MKTLTLKNILDKLTECEKDSSIEVFYKGILINAEMKVARAEAYSFLAPYLDKSKKSFTVNSFLSVLRESLDHGADDTKRLIMRFEDRLVYVNQVTKTLGKVTFITIDF